jgi:hypothetical protein
LASNSARCERSNQNSFLNSKSYLFRNRIRINKEIE